jgi:hypothetical protein
MGFYMFGNPNLSTAPSIWLQTVTADQRSWAPAQAFPEVGRGIAGSCCIAHAPAVCKCHGWNYRCWDGSRWSKGLVPIYISIGVAVLVYQDPFLLHGIPITIANLPFDHAVQRKPQTMCEMLWYAIPTKKIKALYTNILPRRLTCVLLSMCQTCPIDHQWSNNLSCRH